MTTKTKNRKLTLESSYIGERTYESPLVMEYVGGVHPYVWIGDERGWCFATVDVVKLKAFLRGERSQERNP